MIKQELGKIHIYTGNGKGKTSASIGAAIRGAGCGLNVVFSQFLKGWDTGEINILSKIDNILVVRDNEKLPFSNVMTSEIKKLSIMKNNNILNKVIDIYYNNNADIIIFDEVLDAYNYGFVDKEKFEAFFFALKEKSKNIEIIVTGRGAPEQLLNIADYISDINCIKHPYNEGVLARKGIEY